MLLNPFALTIPLDYANFWVLGLMIQIELKEVDQIQTDVLPTKLNFCAMSL